MTGIVDDVESDEEGTPRARVSRYLIMVGVVIMLAGLLFGYDQGVISGALGGIEKSFSMSTFMIEVITSWVTLGALVGALLAGDLADRIGRRSTILIAAATFIVGALLQSLAPGTGVLVAGRLVLGFGVGVASVAAPLYASESAPAQYRGRLVSLYPMAITIGITLAVLQQLAEINAIIYDALRGGVIVSRSGSRSGPVNQLRCRRRSSIAAWADRTTDLSLGLALSSLNENREPSRPSRGALSVSGHVSWAMAEAAPSLDRSHDDLSLVPAQGLPEVARARWSTWVL